MDGLVSDGTNLVIPKVGGEPKFVQSEIDRLVANGYEVFVINVDVPADEALAGCSGASAKPVV